MELRQIEFFLQLYKDRNITVASQNLYISQQGMSKSIANLEKEVGFPLFKRSVSGVEPTAEAGELYIYFRTVMESYTGLQKKIKDIEIYTMEEKEETGLHFLREGLADVAFVFAPVPKDLKSHIIVGREPLCAFINHKHPLAEKEEISLEDLEENTLLFSRSNNIIKKNILKKAKEKAGIDLELQDIPYAQMLHTVYTKEFVGLAPASVFRYMNFPELICKPIKYKEEDFYTVECHLVTMKQDNYKTEVEKYIAYEKKTHGGKYSYIV